MPCKRACTPRAGSAKHTELAAGIRTPARYTVGQCLRDWLATLSTQAETTVTGYQIMASHLTGLIGTVKPAELPVRDVGFALGTLAERLSTGSVRLARMILIQAIRNAMVNDLAGRSQGRAPVAVRRREYARRHPYRGSPRSALVRGGSRGQS